MKTNETKALYDITRTWTELPVDLESFVKVDKYLCGDCEIKRKIAGKDKVLAFKVTKKKDLYYVEVINKQSFPLFVPLVWWGKSLTKILSNYGMVSGWNISESTYVDEKGKTVVLCEWVEKNMKDGGIIVLRRSIK